MTAWAAWRSAPGVSPATAARLSRRLGYAGYAALKLPIAHEAGRADQFGYGRAQPGLDVTASRAGDGRRRRQHPRRGPGRSTQPPSRTRMRPSPAPGTSCSPGLCPPRRWRRWPRSVSRRSGIRVTSAMDALVQHLQADTLRAGEVCVAISHTGESRDTIDVARAAALAGALTIGVTSSAGSPLTQAVQIALVCADQHDPTAQELFANPVAIVSALGALHAGARNGCRPRGAGSSRPGHHLTPILTRLSCGGHRFPGLQDRRVGVDRLRVLQPASRVEQDHLSSGVSHPDSRSLRAAATVAAPRDR